MKIIELNIRNIASIEKADINFETDLIDPDTGLPAQKFLICGDTGSGKTILLDSIALALFKKTPRIEGIEGKLHNKFVSQCSGEINISSIEQYTRIGISHKDECYSQVHFIANDGTPCTARLELGINKNQNLRRPNWTLKTGDGDWQRVDSKGEMIAALTGLNFDQFNRMAMLAQGQFATFLCGDKDERADILERLTNTEIFSRYGEAIKLIAKQKKEVALVAKERMETSAHFLIPDGELEQMAEHITSLTATEQRAATRRKAIEATLAHLQRRDEAQHKADEAQAQLQSLKSLTESDDYKQKLALLAAWDSTDSQRKAYDLLLQNQQALDKAQPEANALQQQIATLTAALVAATLHQINTLGAACQQADQTLQRVTQTLQQHEQTIAAQRQALAALDPAALDRETTRLLRLQAAFERLQADQRQLIEQQRQQQHLQAQLQALQTQIQEAAHTQSQAQARHQTLKEQYEAALRQYTTLNASLDHTLVSLRQRIRDDHTPICPLCGQEVASLLTTDAFQGVVLPYKQRQEEARQQADQAHQQLQAANNSLTSLNAQATLTQSRLQTLTQTILQAQADIEARFAKAQKTETESTAQRTGRPATRRHTLRSPLSTLRAKLASILAQQRILEQKKQAVADLQATIDRNLQATQELSRQQQAAQQQQYTLQTQIDHAREYLQQIGTPDTSADQAQLAAQGAAMSPQAYQQQKQALQDLRLQHAQVVSRIATYQEAASAANATLQAWQQQTGGTLEHLSTLSARAGEIQPLRQENTRVENELAAWSKVLLDAQQTLQAENQALLNACQHTVSAKQQAGRSATRRHRLRTPHSTARTQHSLAAQLLQLQARESAAHDRRIMQQQRIDTHRRNKQQAEQAQQAYLDAKRAADHWDILDHNFGGPRLRNLAQTHILQHLLHDANNYLRQITNRYLLTCKQENEQLAILVTDLYHRNELRSAAVLSGGEKFMISLALALALSSLRRPDMNVNILFIDEGFGTLDQKHLDSVMKTLGSLSQIAAQSNRRVGIISHREELLELIPNKIRLSPNGEGRTLVETLYSWQ